MEQISTGAGEAPQRYVVFKAGSIHSAYDSLIVAGSHNGRCCDVTFGTGSNISIVRADVPTISRPAAHSQSCLHTVTGGRVPIRGNGASSWGLGI